MLAMTETREEEEEIKVWLESQGYKKVVATEVSGPLSDFKQKVMKSAVAAALNTGIIDNEVEQVHSLVHAVLEAVQGILIAALANPSVKVKLAIVREKRWLAVAMFGATALHVQSNHERAGLGVMHI